MRTKLTPVERKRFDICQKQISDGWQPTIDTHAALSEVKQSKLYKEDFDTWEDFCNQTLQLSPQHVNRLIAANVLISECKVLEINKKSEHECSLLTNEIQAHAISSTHEQRADVVSKATAAPQPLTVNTIKEVAEKVVEPKQRKDALRVDNVGQVIPANILELWDRAEADSMEMIHWSAKLKARFKRGMDEGDIIFVEHSANEMFARMRDIRWSCKDLRPHAICYTCQGRIPTQCTTCKGRGFLSFFKWDRQSNEAKALIAKAVASRK